MEGTHLFLRALEPEDIEVLFQWENDLEIWQVSNTLVPFSRHVLEQYIARSSHDIYTTKQLRLMIIKKEPAHEPIGTIDLFDFDPFHQRAGIGIMLVKTERGKGFAGEALRLLIHYAFEYLRLHQLYCSMATNNVSSLDLFTKAGFVITGTKTQWQRSKDGFVDEHFLQLLNPSST